MKLAIGQGRLACPDHPGVAPGVWRFLHPVGQRRQANPTRMAYLRDEDMMLVVVGDRGQVASQLSAFGEVTEVAP